MNLKNRTLSVIFFTIIFMIGIHAIDMGASLEITNQNLGGQYFISQSLVTTMKPYVLYHVGIIMSITSFMIIACLAARVIE